MNEPIDGVAAQASKKNGQTRELDVAEISTQVNLRSTSSIDIEALRLSQDYGAAVDARPVVSTIAVRKPARHAWVRVHPGDDWRLPTLILDLKEQGQYLMASEVQRGLEDQQMLVPKMLYYGVTRDNVPFIWPVKLPGEDGSLDAWNRSAHTAAERAESAWIQIRSDRGRGHYVISEARGDLGEPGWPALPFRKVIDMAFAHLYIDKIDHAVLRRLRGEER